jgi:hypothetical protein
LELLLKDSWGNIVQIGKQQILKDLQRIKPRRQLKVKPDGKSSGKWIYLKIFQ